MKFWEAMKALEEGKLVRPDNDLYVLYQSGSKIYWTNEKLENMSTAYDLHNLASHNFSEVEKEEPTEFYWQWRFKKTGNLVDIGSLQSDTGRYNPETSEKHAGPWIKTEDGFKKHESWEQF